MEGMRTCVLVMALIASVSGVCLESVGWVPVPSDQLDLTYSPITESDKRPLGFSVGQYIYNSDRGTCVTVQGTAGRRIEVQVQAEPATTICIKGNDVETCSEADGKIYMCQEFTAENQGDQNSTMFEFQCNGECAEADVTFWFRFDVSPGISSDDDEQWCWARDQRYPTDLIVLPFVQTTEVPVKENSASSITQHLAALIAGIITLYTL